MVWWSLLSAAAFLQTSNPVKDTCGIPPIQVTSGSANVLPNTIRVRSPPLQTRTRYSTLSATQRPTIGILPSLPSTVPGIEPEAISGDLTGEPDQQYARLEIRFS